MRPPAEHAGGNFLCPQCDHRSTKKTCIFIPAILMHFDPAAGIQKHYPNAFRETPLLEHLRKNSINRLAIVGMMTHMCVDTSVRAAADLGFECLLAHDACATKAQSFGGVSVSSESVQAAFLAAIHGTFAKVLSVDEMLSAL
jgi:nicotinamidase-related amidase